MTRINFEVSDEQNEAINELLEQTGLKTRVRLFNTAFTLLEWAVKERENGNALVSMDERTGLYKELVMPGLPTVVKQPAKVRQHSVGEHLTALSLLASTAEQAKELADVAESFKAPLPPLLKTRLNLGRVVASSAAQKQTKP